MADIVGSLFGVTPELFEQQQVARANQLASQYAQMTPFQQANFAIGSGAYRLAGAFGSEDPMLKLVSQRNAIARQIDYNSPESIMSGVNRLTEAGDVTGALQLSDIARKMQSEIAQRQQREASAEASLAQAKRERAAPVQIQLGNAISAQKMALDQLQAMPQSEDRDVAIRQATYQLDALERQLPQPKQAPSEKYGTDREAVSLELYDKSFANLTPAERAAVNQRVSEEAAKKVPKTEIKNVMPGDKALADIPAFRAKVQGTIEPQLKTLTATDQAITAIGDSLATGNFAAYRAAQVQFAKAIAGAGDLSQKELKAAGADPSLLGGTADYLSTLFSSTPTADTQKKIQSTLQAIRTVAAKQAQSEIDQQRKIALRSPGYDPTAVNEALDFPQLRTGGKTSAAQPTGTPMYARNPSTGERIMSMDNGATWTPVR